MKLIKCFNSIFTKKICNSMLLAFCLICVINSLPIQNIVEPRFKSSKSQVQIQKSLAESGEQLTKVSF